MFGFGVHSQILKSPNSQIKDLIGVFSGGDHLFPFRTEKLSPPAQMVLEQIRESMSMPFIHKPPFRNDWGFFIVHY